MANKFQVKRTTVSGRTPNTTNAANTQYIDAGELALNLTDKKMFSSNGSALFEVGANLASIVVGTAFTQTSGNANFDSGVLFVDGTNNRVGVGTTTPATALHIVGEHRIEHAADRAMSFVRSGANTFSIEHDTARFYFYNSSTANPMLTMMNSGDVGIGTPNPGYKLEVNGSFAATTKSFVINHPTKPDMKLRYGSLEGPENGVYVRGCGKGDTIQLPDYWTGLVDEFSITVNLTPIGSHQKLYVKKIENNTVIVGGGFFDQMEYFYTVFAERKDVDKLIVEI